MARRDAWTTFNRQSVRVKNAFAAMRTTSRTAYTYLGFLWKPFTARYRSFRSNWMDATIGMLVFCVFLASVSLFNNMSGVEYGNVTYHFRGDDTQQGELPLDIPGDTERLLEVTIGLSLHHVHPSVFFIRPDDCLEAVNVNGKRLKGFKAYCSYNDIGQAVDFSPLLKAGHNTVVLTIRDEGGDSGVKMVVSRLDALLIFKLLLLLTGTTVFLLFIRRFFRPMAEHTGLTFAVITGVLLRIVYVASTAYDMRGHDTDAHIDYIEYVAKHLTIPAADSGWENHQPPLYYFVTGLWMKIHRMLGFDDVHILNSIELWSLAFSIIAFLLAAWTVVQLFKEKHEWRLAALGILLLAVFPSLVFGSSRISNDTLYVPIAIGVVSFLLSFWTSGNIRRWYIAMSLLGFALLTKLSALALLPLCLFCLMFQKHIHWKQIILHGIMGCLLLSIIAAWLPLYRLSESDTEKSLTLGNEGMSSGLSVPNDIENFFTFNPSEIILHPYNNPWEDSFRRQYFPEYFFRSAFTGEFEFRDSLKTLNEFILLAAILLLPVAVVGVFGDLSRRFRQALCMFLLSGLLLAAAVAYRFLFAYSANQDFRFSVIALVPFCYYIVRGYEILPPLAKKTALMLLLFLSIAMASFILLLFLPDPS